MQVIPPAKENCLAVFFRSHTSLREQNIVLVTMGPAVFQFQFIGRCYSFTLIRRITLHPSAEVRDEFMSLVTQ
jgi:hypothetical protein